MMQATSTGCSAAAVEHAAHPFTRAFTCVRTLQRPPPPPCAQAAKFRKLPGVAPMLKYWAAPEPRSVPGFAGDAPYRCARQRQSVVGARRVSKHTAGRQGCLGVYRPQ